MARKRPATVEQVSPDLVAENTLTNRSGVYKWDFGDELFNGEWWALEVTNSDVGSALNSYRNQAEARFGKKASCWKGNDGRLYVRTLLDKDAPPRTSKAKK